MYALINPGQKPSFINTPLPSYEEVQEILSSVDEESVFIEMSLRQFKNKNISILVDEEGLLKKKPFCFATKKHEYYGTAILCNRNSKGEFCELTKAQIKELTEWFKTLS